MAGPSDIHPPAINLADSHVITVSSFTASSIRANERARSLRPRKRVAVVSGPIRDNGPLVGRNAACPCGSGTKFKRCCRGKQRG